MRMMICPLFEKWIATVGLVEIWKLLIIIGLVMILLGPYLVRESKAIKQGGVKFENSHRIMSPVKHWLGVALIIIGTLLQIIGVIIS